MTEAEGMECIALHEDAIVWIEEQLNAGKGGCDNLKDCISDLDRLSHSITLSIQQALLKSTTSLPQLQSHFASLEPLLAPIDSDIKEIHTLSSPHKHTSSSSTSEDSEALAQMYRTLERMKKCKHSLEHGIRWEEQVRAFPSSLSTISLENGEQEAHTLSNLLHDMRSSLEILARVPGFEARESTLRTYKLYIQIPSSI